MEDEYKAAAIIFYRDRTFTIGRKSRQLRQVYLQYEKKHMSLSHFGGKREQYDKSSWITAVRELQEETHDLKTPEFLQKHKFSEKKYFTQSKMIVYYIKIYKYDKQGEESNWICIDWLPNNVRSHVVPQIKHLYNIK